MNMKIKKIIITLILIFSFIILGNTEVNASAPTITVNSPEVGSNLNITITFGSDVCSYEGNLKVIWKNGTEYSFGKIGSYEGASGFSRTVSYTTTANVEGEGTVQFSNVELGNANYDPIASGASYGATFTVKAKAGTPTTPTTPTTPVANTTTTPSTPTDTTGGQTTQPVLNNVSTGSTEPVGGTTTTEPEPEPEPEIVVTMKEEVNKTMYVDVSSCNVRKADSKKAEIIGGLRRGAEVKVTGITTNGWYRINYYNTVAYVADVLSNEKPEIVENEVKNEVENKVDNKVKNEVDNEISNETSMENVLENSTGELDELKNSIGVIPEVGNNIFDVLFVIVTVMAIGYVFYVSYKNRDEV